MKKLLAALLVLLLTVSITACGSGTSTPDFKDDTKVTEAADPGNKAESDTTADDEAATVEVTEEPPTDAPVSRIDALESYAAILSEKDGGNFDLIYIDDDDIPELAYFIGGAHLHQVAVYTYCNGSAVHLGEVGAYGTIAYSERNNRIFGYTGMEANPELEAKYTYMIEDGSMVQAPDYEGYELSTSYFDDAIKNTDYTRQMLAVDGLDK